MDTREKAGHWPLRRLTSPLPRSPERLANSQVPEATSVTPFLIPRGEAQGQAGLLLPLGIQTQGRAPAGVEGGKWLNDGPLLPRDSLNFQENQPSLSGNLLSPLGIQQAVAGAGAGKTGAELQSVEKRGREELINQALTK